MEAATQTAIKASELRIGNYLLHEGECKKIYGVAYTSLTFNEVETYYDDYSNEIRECQPIPLTPEILEKVCGKPEAATYRINEVWGVYCTGDPSDEIVLSKKVKTIARIKGVDFDECEYINAPLFHVHQLQNLYFSLTGEELTINL